MSSQNEQLWIVRCNGSTDADPATMVPDDIQQAFIEGMQQDPDLPQEVQDALAAGEVPRIMGYTAVRPEEDYAGEYREPTVAQCHEDMKQKCGILFTQVYSTYTQFLGMPPTECGFGQGTWAIGEVIKTPQLLTLSLTLADKYTKALRSGILSMQIYPVYVTEVPNEY